MVKAAEMTAQWPKAPKQDEGWGGGEGEVGVGVVREVSSRSGGLTEASLELLVELDNALPVRHIVSMDRVGRLPAKRLDLFLCQAVICEPPGQGCI